jgi:hypothetical protein
MSRHLLYVVLLVLAGCGSSATKVEDLNATVVTLPGGRKIMAETKRTEEEMARGMMFRDALPKGGGDFIEYPAVYFG